MKAWLARTENSNDGCADIVFAETAGKAKQKCDWDIIEADRYIDILVNRVPDMDDCENLSEDDLILKALQTETYSWAEIGDMQLYPEDVATTEDLLKVKQALSRNKVEQ